MAEEDNVAPDRDFWDQLPEEPDYWYEHFTNFRLLGPRRSMLKYFRWHRAQNHQPPPTHAKIPAPSIWYEKSKLYNWNVRAKAWDSWQTELLEDASEEVLRAGIALKHERVIKLAQVAEKLEHYILDPKITRVSPYVLEQYRGILDDIAKEVGQRVKETRFTGPQGGPIEITTSWGRGGSATLAWDDKEAIEAALPAAEITELAASLEEQTSDEDNEG